MDWLDKTVACASKRAMLVDMGRLNPTVMAHVTRSLDKSLAIERYASPRLCQFGTSVAREGLADVVLAVFRAETAASITRSVLQRTIRGQMRHD